MLSKFLQVFTVLGSLIPSLLAFMKSLEDSGAAGKDKKAAALTFLETLLGGASGWVKELSADTIALCVQVADHVIDAAVAAYNAIGIFTHKAPKA